MTTTADEDVRAFIEGQATKENQPQETNREQDLATAKALIAGETPLIPDAPDTSVRLARGLYNRGQWQRDAEVRELTGADEEVLAKSQTQDILDIVVALGTATVGDMGVGGLSLSDRQGLLRGLLLGEREALYLAIIQATFGNTRTMGFTCRSCGTEQEIDFLIDEDFRPKEVEVKESYEYTTSKGDVLTIRLATGEDQTAAIELKGGTTASQNTLVLSRCITKRNGALIPDQLGFARGLGIKDRQGVLGLLLDNQPGVDLGVTTKCSACEADVPLALTWSDFFRP